MADIIDDPTTWFLGFISATLMKTKLTDPINQLNASVAPRVVQLLRTTTITLSTGDNLVGSYTSTGFDVGSLGHASGIITIPTGAGGLYYWDCTIAAVITAGGTLRPQLFVNGAAAANLEGRTDFTLAAAAVPTLSTGGSIVLADADTVQLDINSSGAGSATPHTFTLRKIA